MNYSSYLGSKKCDKVICTRGPPGPPGPPGPSGQMANTFTITSSQAVQDSFENTIIWEIDIPYIYGNQFTFTFQTINNNVTPININILPSNDLVEIFSNSYIFGVGQAVYQTYTIGGNTSNLYYAYIPIIISSQGTNTTDGSSFDIKVTVTDTNTITYKFVYQYIPNVEEDYLNLVNSKIKLNGVKYN
jgi:hypothetical protein